MGIAIYYSERTSYEHALALTRRRICTVKRYKWNRTNYMNALSSILRLWHESQSLRYRINSAILNLLVHGAMTPQGISEIYIFAAKRFHSNHFLHS